MKELEAKNPAAEPSGYTTRTRAWLDEVYATRADGEHYVAHEVVFGYGSPRSSPHHAPRIARTGRILRVLGRLGAGRELQTVLDVGAGEAYTTDLVRELYDARVAACDLSGEACRRGRELFGVPTFAADAGRLPVGDASFDLVICSEVLEHLEDPFAALEELVRVTRRVLVVTTMETCHLEAQRRLMLKLRPMAKPHVELNWWMPGDFERLLPGGAKVMRQIRTRGAPSDRERDMTKVKAWLAWAADERGLDREGDGALVIWRRNGGPKSGGFERHEEIEGEALWDLLIAPRPLGRAVSEEDEAWLREELRCPSCGGDLHQAPELLRCDSCAAEYPVRDGVPDLVVAGPEAMGPTRDWQAWRRGQPQLNPAEVRRLRRLFARDNLWQGRRATWGRGMLRLSEFARDLKQGQTLRESARTMRANLADWRRELGSGEGWLVREAGRPEVYRIESGRRRHIVSEPVFHELGYIFDQVKEVDATWLARFPEGEPITEADVK